jgi:hypothetical protein
VAHLLLARGRQLDWPRLLARFRGHEPVLLAHVVLFTYIYPGEKDIIPSDVLDGLIRRVREAPAATEKRLLRGTFLSRAQYLSDLRDRGFIDARLKPRGPMSSDDVAHWTAAIGTIK